MAKRDLAQIFPGVSTKEDVLLRFGEPDAVMRNRTVFLYRWEVSVGTLVAYSGGGEIVKSYYVLLEFNENGMLSYVLNGNALERRVTAEWALQRFDKSKSP